MPIEERFSRRIITMGPSRTDPGRQVGVFQREFLANLPAVRAAKMEKSQWSSANGVNENEVPAKGVSPAYTDSGSGRFTFCEKDSCSCMVAADGRETRQITLILQPAMDLHFAAGLVWNPAFSGGLEGGANRFFRVHDDHGNQLRLADDVDLERKRRFGSVNEEQDEDGGGRIYGGSRVKGKGTIPCWPEFF